ncbi:MAG: cytochrome c biogenesis protein CcdA [Candidatus Diapherotrites archaeon]|nr:cytochrome c biogenesis protein CcdA [Candidatus Diapherotrites archaeon]
MKKLWLVFFILLFAAMVPAQTLEVSEVNIEYYYISGCSACALLEQRGGLDNANATNGITVEKMNISDPKNAQRMIVALQTCGEALDVVHTPTMFVNGECFIGVQPIEEKIEQIIEEVNSNGSVAAFEYENVTSKFELTYPFLLLAAIADSVNPCEFAVLILLMSTVLASKNRKKALYSGLSFSLAIYICYFLMGVGLFSAISALSITLYFYKAVGVLAILVGIFNLKDFIKVGSLGFVMEVPMSWRPIMKKVIKSTTSVPGAFLVGCVVSLFLTPCTSGPYIVIIGMLANSATMWAAIPLLLIYNIVFILPMIAITLFVYIGMTTPEKAEKWRKPRTRYMHLIAGLMMVILGVVILLDII